MTKGKIEKVCPCGTVFSVYRSQAKSYKYCKRDCPAKQTIYVESTCEKCEVKFTRPHNYGTGRFCSDSCRKSWFSSAFKGKYSPHWRGGVNPNFYSKKRRAAMRKGDKIDRIEVFNHFDWICHICNKEIDKSLKFPDKMAATLDHIIPLSKGGRHTWDNVAPAHADCNAKKGANLDTTIESAVDWKV